MLDYFKCNIYIQASASGTGNVGTESHAGLETDKQKLIAWYAKIYAFIDCKLGEFIWNCEPLQLFVNMRGKAIVSEKSATQRARAAQQFENGQRYVKFMAWHVCRIGSTPFFILLERCSKIILADAD
ncbi:hypothetical protein LPJ55_000345 [Coemansia sp. RSA 990]|nr:hypothetical protein LPJ55_000345 [Coemansia sp. RSA 990]